MGRDDTAAELDRLMSARLSWYRLAQKRFWGKSGSGVLFVCVEDGTAMLLLRSHEVEQPGTWGVPGGAVKHPYEEDDESENYFDPDDIDASDEDESMLMDSARNEVYEEIGFMPEISQNLGSVIFQSGGFKYTTFVMAVSKLEKAKIEASHRLNWENDELRFFPLDRLPGNLHFGVVHVLAKHPELNRMTGRGGTAI